MRQRRIVVLVSVALIVLVGAGTWAAIRIFGRAGASPAALGLPTVPSLDSWSEIFVGRVRSAMNAARRDPSNPVALAELARLYHANGFLPEAAQLWERLRALQPREARWPYYLAQIRRSEGDLDAFSQLLRETLELDPDYAPAQLGLAEFLFKQGRFDDAAEAYNRRLALVRDDPYAELGLARIALQRGDRDGAQTRLEKIVRAEPEFSSAWNLLAELARQQGDEERAAKLGRRGFAAGRFRDADDPWLEELDRWCYDPYRLQVLGSIREQTGEVVESLPFFERAVELAPKEASAWNDLGSAYMKAGRLDDARRVLEKGLAANPDASDLYITLGHVWRDQDDPAAAIRLLQDAIHRFPKLADLRNDLGISYDRAGRHEDAIASYREAIRLDPRHFDAHMNLGKSLLELGREKEGEALVRRALEMRPTDFGALVLLSGREIDANDLAAADGHLDTLEAVQPDRPEVHQLRAFWHLRRGTAAARAGRTEEAIRELRAGIAADGSVGDLHANLGVLLAQANRYEEAIEQFKRFTAVAPREPMAYFYLGQALLAVQSTAEARIPLERGLELAQQAGDAELAARISGLLRRIGN